MTPASPELLRAWPNVWRFSDLWLAVTHREPVDADLVASRLAEFALRPPSAESALDALLASGEIDAAELLLTEDGFLAALSDPAERDRLERRVVEARVTLSARFAERVESLERRAARAGLDLDLSAARRWTPGRWKDAEALLAHLVEHCRDAEDRAGLPLPGDVSGRSGVAPKRPAAIVWPVPEAGISEALDWFAGRKPAPTAALHLLPQQEDRQAHRLVGAMDALLTKGADWQQPVVEEFVRAFAAVVGAQANATRALGGGFTALFRGLEAPGLPGLVGGDAGLPIWLAPKSDVQLPVDFRGRLHVAFFPKREQVRRPPALRLDALMLLGVVADTIGRRDRLLRAFARDLPTDLAIPHGWPAPPRPRPVPAEEHQALVDATLGWLDLEPETREVIDRLAWMAGGDDTLMGALLADLIRFVPTRAGSPRGAVTLDDVDRAWRGQAVRDAAAKGMDGLSGVELATLEVRNILEISLPGRALPLNVVVSESADHAGASMEAAQEALTSLEAQGLVLKVDGQVWLPAAGLSAPSLRTGARGGT